MNDDTDMALAIKPGRQIPEPADEPTVSVERAGEVLGISRNSAYEAARAGQIPTIRIGRRILVPTAALLRMLGQEPAA